MSIREVFGKFPDEAMIVGRLLAAYADLEVNLMHCAQVVRDDLDTVLKAMYRARGESRRVDVADAFGKQHYAAIGLGDEFADGIEALRYCLRIRNQYAHSIWHDDNTGKLAFTDLEEIARQDALIKDLAGLKIVYVDVPLLKAQETFFTYTDYLLTWTNFEGQVRRKKIKANPFKKAGVLARPDLYIP